MKLAIFKQGGESRNVQFDSSISFETIKSWLKTGRIWRHFFRYTEVVLVVPNSRYITKPIATILLLRIICRGPVYIADTKASDITVDLRYIARKLFLFFRDSLQYIPLRRAIESKISELSIHISPKRSEALGTRRPVYLRTDLWFGVKAGGSVGHIAGVVNNLDTFFEKPLFCTTEKIPTMRPDIPVTIFEPPANFLDFDVMPSLASNQSFFEQAAHAIGNIPPAFVYQRYCINNYVGVELSSFFCVPLVLEYNGSEVWVAENWGEGIRSAELSKKIELLNLNTAHLIVVVSDALRRELVQRGIDADRILVNPNGVDIERYSPLIEGTEIRRQYQLDQKVVIGFIGTFGRWHGAEVLAAAFALLISEKPALKASLQLMMIGDGITLPAVKSILSDNGLENCCTFTGIVPQAEAPPYLASCDILVSPQVPNADGSPFFGSPTKLFEYMAMGKPIVASDLDQIGEVLSHTESALLFAPGDVLGLARALSRLIDDPELRRRLGQKARAEVEYGYSWREHTRRIVEKLENICVQ